MDSFGAPSLRDPVFMSDGLDHPPSSFHVHTPCCQISPIPCLSPQPKAISTNSSSTQAPPEPRPQPEGLAYCSLRIPPALCSIFSFLLDCPFSSFLLSQAGPTHLKSSSNSAYFVKPSKIHTLPIGYESLNRLLFTLSTDN